MEKDGYGGRSRRLKQVWALQTEEAVQSSECFEWNEILSSGVCACMSFIFKLVCCQFSHSFWKHFENVLTWTIQNWILLREIISLKKFSLHFHNHLKSIWHIYYYLFSCLRITKTSLYFYFSFDVQNFGSWGEISNRLIRGKGSFEQLKIQASKPVLSLKR